jgi:hypothetical protein
LDSKLAADIAVTLKSFTGWSGASTDEFDADSPRVQPL